MRRYYWYATAYLRKHGWKVLASVVTGVAIFSITVPIMLNPAVIKPKEYVGLIGEYTPTTLPEEIQQQLSIGLTTIAPDGSALPGLSERWTLEQENQTYRFFLDKEAKWQDGTPITSEDIQYYFPDVQIITTPNDVIFKLPAPFAPFPTKVAQPIFKSGSMSSHLFSKKPVLIGIGATWISDYVLNGNKLKQLSLENKNKVIQYRFYKTEDEAIDAFKRGDVDFLPDLNRTFDVMQWPTVETTANTNYWNYIAVYFNTRDPLLTKNVRQALSYGLEKREDENRAFGPISPDSWAFLPGGKTYDKDWDRGIERLLDEVPGEPLHFDLTTTSVHASLAEKIKAEWEAFGLEAVKACQEEKKDAELALCPNLAISITIKVQNFPDTGNFQLLLIGTPIEPDPDQYGLWHSDQSTNFTGYKNTRIDNLLEKGRQISDQSERKEIYQEFQQFLQEDPPAIFLEYLTSYAVKRKNPLDGVMAIVHSRLGSSASPAATLLPPASQVE